MRADDLASLLASRSGLNIGSLARWMVEGKVVHFDWQHDTWFPMFQFAAAEMAPRVCVGRVIGELGGVFDLWGMAQWFACALPLLDSKTPADALALEPHRVWQAARHARQRADG